jgi:ornithine carbamoyltransferase
MSTVIDLHGRHFLNLSDHTADEIVYSLDLTAKLKAEKRVATSGG